MGHAAADQAHATEEGSESLRPRLAVLLVALGIRLAPSASLQIGRYLQFGTPIYPFQFEILGFGTDVGFPQQEVSRGAGLTAPDWRGMLASFRRGWLWPGEWPRDFFDSRLLGAGLFFWLMWLTLPILDRILNRDTAFLILIFTLVAIVIQDFWLPRWLMTIVLAIVLCVGGALSWLASRGPSLVFLLLLSAVTLHLGRPIYDAVGMTQVGRSYIRVNISESPLFIDDTVAPGELELYPDLHADFMIVRPIDNEFSLLLYGQDLSNRIVGVLDPAGIGESCLPIQDVTPGRQTLIVDQTGKLGQLSGHCKWVCEYSSSSRCLAGRLVSED